MAVAAVVVVLMEQPVTASVAVAAVAVMAVARGGVRYGWWRWSRCPVPSTPPLLPGGAGTCTFSH